MHGKLDEKIDVYAYGIVLLELLSGRRPIDDRLPKGKESLVMWVRIIFSWLTIYFLSLFEMIVDLFFS